MEAMRRNDDLLTLFSQLETALLSRVESTEVKSLQRRKSDRNIVDLLPVKPILRTKELMNHYEVDGITFYLTPTDFNLFIKSSGIQSIPALVRKGILRKAIPGPVGLKETIKFFKDKEQVTI